MTKIDAAGKQTSSLRVALCSAGRLGFESGLADLQVRAFLMTEQFGGDQRGADRRAVHTNKRVPRKARTVPQLKLR